MRKERLRLITADASAPSDPKHPFGLQYPNGRVVRRHGHVVRDPSKGPRLFQEEIEFFHLYCDAKHIVLTTHPTRAGYKIMLGNQPPMEILWNTAANSYTVDRRLSRFIGEFKAYIEEQLSHHGSLNASNFLDTSYAQGR